MSRSGYSDDYDLGQWSFICWRGAVTSAIRGRRGQAFLREMLDAMDALPEPKLIAHELETADSVCAIGTVGRKRGIDMTGLDPEDSSTVAGKFGISDALAREIVYINDEAACYYPHREETPEMRFFRVRKWVIKQFESPFIREDESGRWADDGGRV